MVWLWGNTRSRERARYSSLLPVPGPGGAQPPWPCWMPGLCGAETCFVHASRSHVFLSPGVTQRVRMGGSAGEYLESVCCHGCDGMWPCVCVCVCMGLHTHGRAPGSGSVTLNMSGVCQSTPCPAASHPSTATSLVQATIKSCWCNCHGFLTGFHCGSCTPRAHEIGPCHSLV